MTSQQQEMLPLPTEDPVVELPPLNSGEPVLEDNGEGSYDNTSNDPSLEVEEGEKGIKGKYWLLTINCGVRWSYGPDFSPEKFCEKLRMSSGRGCYGDKIVACCGQVEMGNEKQREHIHMFIEFDRDYPAFKWFQSQIPGVNVQKVKTKNNRFARPNTISYCVKEDTYLDKRWFWNIKPSEVIQWGSMGGKKDGKGGKKEKEDILTPAQFKYNLEQISRYLKQNPGSLETETDDPFFKKMVVWINERKEQPPTLQQITGEKKEESQLEKWQKKHLEFCEKQMKEAGIVAVTNRLVICGAAPATSS